MAGKQYSGGGLAVTSSPEGARLQCVFQRLNARVTRQGLWLASTADGARGEPLRVIARTLGRERAETLPPTGDVKVMDRTVQFVRPGLREEYHVSVDGVQQDFVIEQRPAGTGPVRLELELDGAKAEAMGRDIRLVLADGGRQLVYHRLKAEDARGREVPARMEVVSASRLAVVLTDATAEYPVRIDPTFSDANWVSLGGAPGVDATVYAAVVDPGGNLYIGGDFTIAGTVRASKIARWNGTNWSPLGSGMDQSVNALAWWNGQLYAGGNFTVAGGTPVNHIATWNGSTWSALGLGITGGGPVVYALAAGSVLYAGGDFTTAGGNPAQCMAQWNGGTWSPIGNAFPNTSAVLALAVSGTTLYAAGFDIAVGTNLNDIVAVAQCQAGIWSRIGSGNFTSAGNGGITAFALAVSGTTLYIGGDFTLYAQTNFTSITVNRIAKWDGTTWSAMGSGMDDRVMSLWVSGNGTVYAGGQFNTADGNTAHHIAQWSGGIWSQVGLGIDNIVDALVMSGTTLYAGGGFVNAGTNSAGSIAQWNGTNWSSLGLGINGTVEAVAASGTTLYAGGNFTTVGTNTANHVAQWNGSSWSPMGSGMNSNVLALAVSGGTVYAGGNFTTTGTNTVNHIAQWNGSTWSALGSGMNGAVEALAVSGATLYAGGAFTTAGTSTVNRIAQWNGSGWLPMGLGMNSDVLALAVSGGTLYAGGAFTTAGTNTAANHIAPWDGTNWSGLASGMNSNVLALAVSGTTLYAGGYFTMAGTNLVSHIAQWNGSTWSALGSGMNGSNNDYVASLAALNGTLYAGGYFRTAGGTPANYIAQWNGTNWLALGSGVGGFDFYPIVYPSVNALAVSATSLYAGGFFTTAGTNVSPAIAEAIVGTAVTPPVILNDGHFGFTNNHTMFGFDVSNSTSQTFVLASSNLVDWISLQTNTLGNSLWYFTDPSASNFTHRFYRAETP